MKRGIAAVLLLVLLLGASAQEAGLPAVGARELIERPRDYEGKEILFRGEAIGDPLRRGDHAWVNLLDPYAAIGVYLPTGQLSRITSYGSYKSSGDLVSVRGVFHRACAEHGGDMDIHAGSLEVLARGGETAHKPSRIELALLPLSFALALSLYLLWKKREGEVKKVKRPY